MLAHRQPGSIAIDRIENTQVINTVGDQVRASVHVDYLQTAMDAGGYAELGSQSHSKE